MQILLDTHTFIWFINGDSQLPEKACEEIKKIENKCYLSIASIWEIAIKISLGRLKLKSDFNKIAIFISENEIEILPLSFEHIQTLIKLKYYHRDPFDRIIISQGIVEALTILTKNEDFERYDVELM